MYIFYIFSCMSLITDITNRETTYATVYVSILSSAGPSRASHPPSLWSDNKRARVILPPAYRAVQGNP